MLYRLDSRRFGGYACSCKQYLSRGGPEIVFEIHRQGVRTCEIDGAVLTYDPENPDAYLLAR
jgi:hypothetical protein